MFSIGYSNSNHDDQQLRQFRTEDMKFTWVVGQRQVCDRADCVMHFQAVPLRQPGTSS